MIFLQLVNHVSIEELHVNLAMIFTRSEAEIGFRNECDWDTKYRNLCIRIRSISCKFYGTEILICHLFVPEPEYLVSWSILLSNSNAKSNASDV